MNKESKYLVTKKSDLFQAAFDQERAMEEKIQKLERELVQWKRYVDDLEQWHSHMHEDEMHKAMTKPNRPGYHRANND